MDSFPHWYAIVNPSSAHGKTAKLWPAFYQKLCAGGVKLDYALTTRPGEGTVLTREALRSGYRHIISVGGDGTLNEVVNGFFADGEPINPKAELAVLAHGTGSDFVRSINLAKGIDPFIQLLKRGQVISVDVGKAAFADPLGHPSFRYFINVGDVGLGGATAASVNRRSKRLGGRLSFLLGVLRNVLNYKNQPMRCSVDGHRVADGITNSIMVANGKYIGGGMMIAPHAVLDDGFFDVIIIDKVSTGRLLRCFPLIYLGKHLNIPEVRELRGKHVEIESPQGIIDLDGEQPGNGSVTFDIEPKAISVWI